jgi:hypothetical protein
VVAEEGAEELGACNTRTEEMALSRACESHAQKLQPAHGGAFRVR